MSEQTQAVSSPAQETPVSTPAASPDIHSLSSKDYDSWRMTGKLPEAKKDSTQAASSTAQESSAAEPKAGEAAETGTASEAEKTAQEQSPKKRGNAETRIQELLAEQKRLKSELEQLKAPKTQAESSPAKPEAKVEQTRQKPSPNDTNKDGSPKYATYEDYLEDMADWKAEGRIAALRAEQAKAQKDAEAAQQRKTVEDDWKARVGEAGKKYADFADVAFNKDLVIPAGSPLDSFALNSKKYGTDVLYHLAKNPAELERVNSLPLAEAWEEMVSLGISLNKPPDAKKVTSSPPPPKEVGTTSATPEDEVAAAQRRGDFTAYREAMNRREIAKRRG